MRKMGEEDWVCLLDWRVVVQSERVDVEDVGGAATGDIGQWVDLVGALDLALLDLLWEGNGAGGGSEEKGG